SLEGTGAVQGSHELLLQLAGRGAGDDKIVAEPGNIRGRLVESKGGEAGCLRLRCCSICNSGSRCGGGRLNGIERLAECSAGGCRGPAWRSRQTGAEAGLIKIEIVRRPGVIGSWHWNSGTGSGGGATGDRGGGGSANGQ